MNQTRFANALRRHRPRTAWRAMLAAASLLAGGTAQAALTLDAVMHADPARPGETLQLDLTVTNTDPFARSGVAITMEYPADMAATSEANFDGDCASSACEAGETITWLLGSIPAGGHVTVAGPFPVAGGVASGTVITFEPTVTDDFGGNASDTASVTINASTRFDLAMAENADPAAPGDTLDYKISWGYRADSGAVTQSQIEFDIPAGTSFISASDGGTSDGSTVTWPMGFLLPGESGVREVTVAIGGGVATPSVLETEARLINVALPAETATASTATVVTASKPLSLVIETNSNPAQEGEFANVVAVVTNNDPFTRFDVTLTAQHPQDIVQLFEDGKFDGDCASSACEPNERITWLLGDLPPGRSVSVVYPPRITTTAVDGVLVNMFFVADDSLGAQVKQADTLRIQDDVLYDLTLAEDADPAAPGDLLTYRVHFGYRSTAPSVNNSALDFKLPAGTSFVSASDAGSLSGDTVSWALGILSPGEGGIRDVTVALDGALPSALETYAEIYSNTTPVERARAEAATSLAATSPLTVNFETNTQASRASELTNVRLVVTNNDPFPRFGTSLTMQMPADINQLFETSFDGDCGSSACETNERITWLLGDLPAGSSRTVVFPGIVNASVVNGELVNFYARIVDDQGVEARANDALRLQDDTVYDISLTESSDPASPGDTLYYQVSFAYRADAAATSNTRLRLALPDGVTLVSASDGGAVNVDGQVEWALGILSPGDGGQRQVEVTVDGGLADATVLQAEAIVEAIASPLEHSRSQAATLIAADRPLTFSIEANPKPGRPGETTNLQMTVSNRDPFTRFGVTLRGKFPQNVNQLFESNFDGDCPSSACEAGEFVTWAIGDIPAGGSRVVRLPVTLQNGNIDGQLVNFYMQLTDDTGFEARDLDTIRMKSVNPYEVAVGEDTDPASPGDTVTYDVTYGYRADAAAVSSSALKLTLPVGMTATSASNNGSIDGNVITWQLGFLSPGDGGKRQVTAVVDGGVAPASILRADAHLFAVFDPIEGARAEALTSIAAAKPLSLAVTSAPNPAQPLDTLDLQVAITNNDLVSRFGVDVIVRHPQGVNQLFEGGDFLGQCPSSACEVGELVIWTIPELFAGETVLLAYPPVVNTGQLDGELIDFYFNANDDTGVQARAVEIVRVGLCPDDDSDCDGLADDVDNCPLADNLSQTDTDGDDIGNACDADLNNDCAVNFADLAGLKAGFSPVNDPEADFNGDGFVNFGDLAILKASFFNSATPGPGPGLPGNLCE